MQVNRDKSTVIWDTLFRRLSDRGLTLLEILRLTKDVFNIVREGGDFTKASVNQKLESLGWRHEIMDEICFELVIYLLENEEDYEVEKHTLH